MKFVRITQTCNACPSQWDAWDENDTYYYVRYRWGCLTVHRCGPGGEEVFHESVGDEYDGVMTTEEMVEHVAGSGDL